MAETERVTRETGIHWHRDTKGRAVSVPRSHELELNDRSLALLREVGAEIKPISIDDVVALEPALAHVRDKFVGAMHAASDEMGDARRFTEGLAEVCRSAA
jgi:D-amino-acid dehydrogenase